MVSFWPFGREDANSPKSFEKALATLSDKIQRLQIRDDTLRNTHRRVKVLFTLYGFFAYILVFLILTLVTGYEKWHAAEWSAIAGSPVAIFAFRYLVDLYFDWREGNVRTRLEKATKERDKVIKKLKDAMRYDSTKELLDKYGGSEAKRDAAMKQKGNTDRKASGKQAQPVQRTGFAPPLTANIPGRTQPLQPAPDMLLRNTQNAQANALQRRPAPLQPEVSESFAANAFDDPPPRSRQAMSAQPARTSFLDRVLDLIVGEDESAARNRIVLLCTSCRTVNGQAPPGVRTVEQLGRWRCGTCGAWNGVESEAKKILNAAQGISSSGPSSPVHLPPEISRESSTGSDEHGRAHEKDENEMSEQETMKISSPAASTRSKTRQS